MTAVFQVSLGCTSFVEKYCKVQSLLQSNSEELIYDCLPPLTLASLLCYCSVVFGENSIYCTSHYPETFFSSLQAGHGPSIVRPVHASILQEAFERMVGKSSSVPGLSGAHIIVEKYCKVQSLLQSNSEELIYVCLPRLTLASLFYTTVVSCLVKIQSTVLPTTLKPFQQPPSRAWPLHCPPCPCFHPARGF